MPKIKVDDIEMYYEIHGQGQTLVLVAGLGTDHRTWALVLPALARQYQVLVFDNRGAGQSDAPAGPYRMEQLADDLKGLCQALHIEQAVFAGNSMGGHIVQTLAYRHPELMQGIVISHSSMKSPAAFAVFLDGQLELIKAKAPALGLIKSVMGWVYSSTYLSDPSRVEALVELKLADPYPMSEQAFTAQLAAVRGFDSRAWVGKINATTLVLGSDEDLIYSEILTRAIAAAIPNAEYYSFKASGHLPHQERPEEFVAVIERFVDRCHP